MRRKYCRRSRWFDYDIIILHRGTQRSLWFLFSFFERSLGICLLALSSVACSRGPTWRQ